MELSDFTVVCSRSGSIPIATLPYTFADGMFTAYVTMNLVYSAEGEICLSYTVNGVCGITYTLMNAELNTGIAALAQKEQGQTGGAVVYFYLDGSYGYGSVLEPYGICGAKVIYGKNNSPLKYEIAL